MNILISRPFKFKEAPLYTGTSGKKWKFWKGPVEGNGLVGPEDQDLRSLAITKLDLSKVKLGTFFPPTDPDFGPGGRKRQEILKATGHVFLDAQIALELYQNPAAIPDSWKEKARGFGYKILFEGTALRGPCGDRCAAYLAFSNGLGWSFGARELDENFNRNEFSAYLEVEQKAPAT